MPWVLCRAGGCQRCLVPRAPRASCRLDAVWPGRQASPQIDFVDQALVNPGGTRRALALAVLELERRTTAYHASVARASVGRTARSARGAGGTAHPSPGASASMCTHARHARKQNQGEGDGWAGRAHRFVDARLAVHMEAILFRDDTALQSWGQGEKRNGARVNTSKRGARLGVPHLLASRTASARQFRAVHASRPALRCARAEHAGADQPCLPRGTRCT